MRVSRGQVRVCGVWVCGCGARERDGAYLGQDVRLREAEPQLPLKQLRRGGGWAGQDLVAAGLHGER